VSDSRDQFFSNLFDENSQTSGFFRQLGYENRTVRRVFNECGVRVPSFGRLANLCRDETGHTDFSFDWFNHRFPRFPGKLCGKRIGYCGYRRDDAGNKQSLSIFQLSIGELMAVKHNVLLRAIAKALYAQQVDTEKPFVFVFPVVKKMFCAHNLELPPGTEDAPRVRWVFDNKVTVEHSVSAFRAIGPEWFED
jgi:hypothetical protein